MRLKRKSSYVIESTKVLYSGFQRLLNSNHDNHLDSEFSAPIWIPDFNQLDSEF